MPRIAISYRREDSQSATARMAEKLVSHFGRDGVFMDIDNIPPGIDFLQHIRNTISRSDVLLAVIGKNWLSKGNKKRLASTDDVVRIEIETALQSGILVIPVLVDNAKMPTAKNVPDGLRDLLNRNGVVVDPGRDFHVHMDRLSRGIERQLGERAILATATIPVEDRSAGESAEAAAGEPSHQAPASEGEQPQERVEQLGLHAVRAVLEADEAISPTTEDEGSRAPSQSKTGDLTSDLLASSHVVVGRLGLHAVRAALESNEAIITGQESAVSVPNESESGDLPADLHQPSDPSVPDSAAKAAEQRRASAQAPAELPDFVVAREDKGQGTIPPARQRDAKKLFAVMATVAVIAGAGLFAYNTLPAVFSSAMEERFVVARTPFPESPKAVDVADAPLPKPVQDRIGAPPATERVVPREEQPVSLPAGPAPLNTAPQPPAQAVAPLVSPPPPAAINEPRRVRTIPMRSDASDGTADGQATRPTVPRSDPLAIAPPAAARLPSGAYVVQVSAQKTEDEARASYQALQQKYPGVLGGRDVNIRRVDLGDKVYYRAQIGPFATAEQANSFCGDLKAAGGQCIVQKN